MALCELAVTVFKPLSGVMAYIEGEQVPGPCPALEEGVGGRFVCGLATNPATYVPVLAKRVGNLTLSKAAGELIGTGLGCDSQLPHEPDDPVFETRMEETSRARAAHVVEAWRVWNGS